MLNVIIFYLKSHFRTTGRTWKKFDNLFSVLGILIAVATLTIANSLFEGYERTLKSAILGANSHIYIFRDGKSNINQEDLSELKEYVKKRKEVTAYSPLIVSQVMISANKRIHGGLSRGIDWKRENQPTEYRKFIIEGSYQLYEENDGVIGEKLAKRLNVTVGDTVKIISPVNSKFTPLGIKTNEKSIRIVGIYRSGMHEYDNTFLFINSTAAFALLNTTEFTLLEIKLNDKSIDKAESIATSMQYDLGMKYQIQTWIDYNGNLFSLLRLEKWVLFIILLFLVLIASFSVVSSALTSIMEKKKEIGILKAYGASNKFLQQLIIGRIIVISIFAVLIGQITGIIIAWLITQQDMIRIKGDVYFIDKLSVHFNPMMLIIVFLASMLIIVIATLIPLRKISTMQITDIIRK